MCFVGKFKSIDTIWRIVAAIIVGVLCCVIINAIVEVPFVTRDGIGYLSIAKQIHSVEYWFPTRSAQNIVPADLAATLRTPIYPLFLAVAESVIGSLPATVVLAHLIVGMLAVFICWRSLKEFDGLSLRISLCLSFTILILINDTILRAVLCEWIACVLLLAQISVFSRGMTRSSAWHTNIGVSTIGVLIALLKPALIPATIIVVGIYTVKTLIDKKSVVSVKKRLSQALVIISFFVIPISLWCFINTNRIGAFAIAPYGGVNMMGLATLIGSAEIQTGDTDAQQTFINYVNQHKIPQRSKELEWIDGIRDNYRKEHYDHNLWLVADVFRKTHNVSLKEYNEMALNYARRVIWKYPTRYIRYFYQGLTYAATSLSIGLLSFICARILSKHNDQRRIFSWLTATAFVCHFVTICIECGTITWLPRYEMMTGGVVYFFACLVVLNVCFADIFGIHHRENGVDQATHR